MFFRMLWSLLPAAALWLSVLNADAAPINLAPSGSATQSSTFCCDSGINGAASKAIDGNTDGNFYHGSVTHTNGQFQPFWLLDLEAEFVLGSITLWNRTDCCGDRLSNFRVSVLDSAMSPVFSDDFFTGGGTFASSLDIPLPADTVGQYVRVQLLGTNALQLAEVQVFAAPEPGTLALLGLGLTGLAVSPRRRRSESPRLRSRLVASF